MGILKMSFLAHFMGHEIIVRTLSPRNSFFRSVIRVFPRPFTHGGTSVGGQSVNEGELMRRDIDLMGGPNFDRLYHKLKVLLMLSCNYTMQSATILLNSLVYILSLSNLHNDAASIQKNRGDESHHVNVTLLILL